MAFTATEIAMRQYPTETIHECIVRLEGRTGDDMDKFIEWMMKMYPKTEDYMYISKHSNAFSDFRPTELYLRVKPDPQVFLEQMKDFDEMMED